MSIGFCQADADPCVYIKEKSGLIILAVYVDDLIIASESENELHDLKKHFASQFKMKDMGELHYCLGVTIEQDHANDCIWMHQQQYVHRILNRYGLGEAKMYATPIDTCTHLKKRDNNLEEGVDPLTYQSKVGSLMYVAVATRPDISYAVGLVSKYNSNPSRAHPNAVKRIFQYLKFTSDYSLRLRKSDDELIAYSDTDWAGDKNDRHSTSGYVFMLASGSISWSGRKQAVVALSAAEAEYIALSSPTQEIIWLRRLLTDLHSKPHGPTELKEDNQGAIAIAKNPVTHNRTKHIDIRYHFVRENVHDNVVNMTYCPSVSMIAAILTKLIPRVKFEQFRTAMGVAKLCDVS